MVKRLLSLALVLCAALGLSACKPEENDKAASNNSGTEIRLLSGSENKSIEPILQEAARQAGATLKVTYKGSVDIMLELEKGKSSEYDAVMPADRMWITLGDKTRAVKNIASIYRSPVVFGVKRSVAEKLGWTKNEVKVADILKAAQDGKLRFMMTSATQSNSGAAAYFGFLYAFAGNPEVLSESDLDKPQVGDKVKTILGSVNRTAGSSGWLKDLFLDRYDYFDAMVNYESMIIETNQALVQQGREPLYAVYPVDGLAIADAPLGLVAKGDPAKDAAFAKIQDYLLSAPVQNQLLNQGRRTGLGVNASGANQTVFNPALGIDINKVLTPITMPAPEVIEKALTLYQTAFRKPSLTVFVLDFSGSMAGSAEEELKNAMRVMLDQSLAKRYMLQASPKDVFIVVPFDSQTRWVKKVEGNDQNKLMELWQAVAREKANNGTDIYSPVIAALPEIRKYNYENYSTSVILMTDGKSEGSFDNLKQSLAAQALTGMPVYSIMFGAADPSQLNAIAVFTTGKVFNGSKDLISAFREAKGYN
jgi:Ca-activated chloride channel family protein